MLLHVRIDRHDLARSREHWEIGLIGRTRHGARHRLQHIDGRIAPALGSARSMTSPRTPTTRPLITMLSSSLICSARAIMQRRTVRATNGYPGSRDVNAVFTRAVNHCVVLGSKAASPGQNGGASRQSLLLPKLNVKHERQRG